MTLNTQVLTLVTMIIGGIYIGFAQETYRRFVKYWERNIFFKYLFEAIFWMGQTVIIFYLLYRVNNGEFRFVILFACFLGFSMYIVFFQAIYKKILEWLIQLVIRILKILRLLLLVPLMFILRTCMKSIWMMVNGLKQIFLWVVRLMLNVLKLIIPKKFLNYINKFLEFCSTMINKLMQKWKSFF